MGFEALVEGYVKGQELHMKKAREVADKAAEEWSRQFKVQQAKQQAAQQEIQNKFEADRVRLEGEAQKRLADKQIADDERKKRDQDIREAHWKAVNDIAAKKMDLSTEEKRAKARIDLTYKYESLGLGHEEAVNRALDTMQAGVSYGQGTGLPMPQQQPQQQGVPPQILQMLHGVGQQMGGNPPPVPQPTSQVPQQPQANMGASVLPGVASKIGLQNARAQQATSIADQIKANTDLIRKKVETEAWKPAKEKAETAKIKQETQNLKDEADRKAKEFSFHIADLTAGTSEKIARANQILAQTQKTHAEVAAIERENQLGVGSIEKVQKARHALAQERNSYSDKARDEYINTLLYHNIVADYPEYSGGRPKSQHTYMHNETGQPSRPYTQAEIYTLSQKAVTSQALQEQYQREEQRTNHEINVLDAKIAESGKLSVDKASGAVSATATAANQRATAKEAAQSARDLRQQPSGVLTPEAKKIVDRSRELGVGPGQHKKKIEKKKGRVVYSEGGITIREK